MSKVAFNAPSKLPLWKRLANYWSLPTKYRNLSKVVIVETTPKFIKQVSSLISVNIDGGDSFMVVWKYTHDSYFWQPDVIEFHNWKGVIGLISKLDDIGFVETKNET